MTGSSLAIMAFYVITILFCLILQTLNALKSNGHLGDPQSLELVQIVYRHGDRSPNSLFSTDVNNDYWTDGLGQLTNLGKQQHLDLGQYIRQRYAGFLNESYVRDEILVNSTDVDRTLMSAYCNLAGLYSPTGDQVWNDDIAWQPIPVHSLPQEINYIVDPDFICPKKDVLIEAVKASPQVQQVNEENADLFALVTNKTEYYVYDIFSLSPIHDTLFCDKCHNLTIPDWVDPIWAQMEYLHNLELYLLNGRPALYRLLGGPMVGHMIENMKAKIDGSKYRKAYIFSSHDTKIVAFLSVFGAWNFVAPPYASAVFVELHKMEDGNHGVQVFYRNDTTTDLYELVIATCDSPCPIEDFIELTQASVPDDIAKECFVIES